MEKRRTQKAAACAVMANPPLPDLPGGIDGTEGERPREPINPRTSAAARHADLPMLGIEFKQFSTRTFYKFVALFQAQSPHDSHVYEVTVRQFPDAADAPVRWIADATVDGRTVFTLESRSKHTAVNCALVAMRARLVRSHRAAWRAWKKGGAA